MKVKNKNMWESFYYCLLCICSFGMWYGIRVMITKAIKQALQEMED